MAYIPRTITQIQQQIIDQKNSYASLNGLSSPSQTAIWRLWTFIVAVSISLLEQILAIFSTDIETSLTNRVAGTPTWIKNNLLLFQYDAIIPQIITIDSNYNISYPIVDTTKQIITQAAINVISNNTIQIKVAKQTPPIPLTTTELNAVQGYLNEIMPAGIYTQATTADSDKILIKGTIYYNGLYSATIQANVELAINTYLENLPFGGKFVVSELEHEIINVTGVKDINITRIQARKDIQTFVYGGNSPIYVLEGAGGDLNYRSYNTFAGYLVPETTTNYTLADTLTYTIQ